MSSRPRAAQDTALTERVSRGLVWSAVNNIGIRLAGMVVGIVLARLLTPEQFGVYAVALTVQLILVTLADLGIGADLIRRGDIDRRGPTVATIGILAGTFVAGVMVVLAVPVASLLGSAAAAPIVRMMSLTLVLSGLGVVPYAIMQREFMQSRQLVVDGVGLGVSTAVTIGLVLVGIGPMALAIGRVASQALTTAMQFAITRTRPRFGWNREIARPALAFGLPIAAANLLSWVILNVDNMLVGHRLGATALGIYVLAFNLSSWPMNALGMTIRSVALPAFSRLDPDPALMSQVLARCTALTAALAVPMSLGMVIFATQIVDLLYGAKWVAAASVLVALGTFGLLRVVFDLFASFLYARGESRAVMVVQVLWLIGLAPAMMVGIEVAGLVGAGWAHVFVAIAILLPAYLVALKRSEVALRPLAHAMYLPLIAVLPAAVIGLVLVHYLSGVVVTLLLGGAAFTASYALLVHRPVLTLYRAFRPSPVVAARRTSTTPATSEHIQRN